MINTRENNIKIGVLSRRGVLRYYVLNYKEPRKVGAAIRPRRIARYDVSKYDQARYE